MLIRSDLFKTSCWFHVSRAEIKETRKCPYAQKAYFSQMLCTNWFISLLGDLCGCLVTPSWSRLNSHLHYENLLSGVSNQEVESLFPLGGVGTITYLQRDREVDFHGRSNNKSCISALRILPHLGSICCLSQNKLSSSLWLLPTLLQLGAHRDQTIQQSKSNTDCEQLDKINHQHLCITHITAAKLDNNA